MITIYKIILVILVIAGIFIITWRLKPKNEIQEIHRLLDKLEKSQMETLEMLDKRAIR